MRWIIRDHGAFQRGVLLLVAIGAGLGALGGFVWMDRPELVLAAVVGGAAAASVLTGARGRTPAVVALLLLGMLLGVALAIVTWTALAAGGAGEGWSIIERATAGALFGLVAGLGLLPAQLGRVERDRVTAALAAARARLAGDRPATEEWTLVQRAAAAHQRTASGVAGDPSPTARELRDGAAALTLQVIDLAGRCRDLRQELSALDAAELASRGSALEGAAGATEDPAARDDFVRAARATVQLGERLRALRGAHDRLRARLSLQVSILESTALALSTRRASSIAQEAASLGPLLERVREAGTDLEAEAQAFAEAAS
jgi:hypothetical protein